MEILEDGVAGGGLAHRIPAMERAVDVLEGLAAGAAGIRDLTVRLGIPRSTVYRVLNSLEARGLAVRGSDNLYRLGPQLPRLARAVPSGFDLVAVSRPLMEDLARALRCSVKLSVLDAGVALVVATAESPETYSVTTQVGRRFPLHAGAASKVLLAFSGEGLGRRLLGGALPGLTPATITDPATLQVVLPWGWRRRWRRSRPHSPARSPPRWGGIRSRSRRDRLTRQRTRRRPSL